MFRKSILANKLSNQLNPLTAVISPLRQSLDFESRESVEQSGLATVVFRRGIDRQDMHSSVAHDLHVDGPEGQAWPPLRNRKTA